MTTSISVVFRPESSLVSSTVRVRSGRGLGCHRRLDRDGFRQAGGMPPIVGVREIGRRIGRCASTISRELRRNASTRGRGVVYRATTAQWHAQRRATARRWRSWPPTTSFATTCRIASVGRSPDRTASRCQDPKCAGPVAVTGGEQIGGGRSRGVLSRSRSGSGSIFPDNESMRICHEANYQALYVQGRGALRRELVAYLRL